MNDRITDEINELLSKIDQSPKGNPLLPGTVRLIDVHIYDVSAEDLPGSDAPTVEGILEQTVAQESQEPDQSNGEPWEPGQREEPHDQEREPVKTTSTRAHRPPLFPLVLVALCIVLAGAVTIIVLLPLLAPSVMVTIIPASEQVRTTSTIHIVAGNPNAAQQQLQGRVLSSVTMSQARTVPTTGTVHQDAKAGRGSITLYNAATYAQTVTADTLMIGADGIQVVTEQDAVIPAAVMPTEGQATVSAHATITGPVGNIRAGDIYGPCCRLNISAANGAFRGGQDARTYQTVTQQDVNGAVSDLKTSLEQSVQAALQTQVRSSETLITPLPCTQNVAPDHGVGDEASQVRITVDETCAGEVYSTQAYHDLITQIVSQQAIKQLGEGYTLSGDIQVAINKTTLKDHGAVDLEVKGVGTWAYQFSQEQLEHLKTMIVGKSETQAKAIILQVPGTRTVSLTFKNTTSISTDTKNIHCVLIEMV